VLIRVLSPVHGNCHFRSMSKSIKQWLCSGREYQLGVALYNTYGDNEAMKKMFEQGYSEYRQERLVQALAAIKEPNTISIPIIEQPKAAIVSFGKFLMPELKVEENKDPYRAQWIPLFNEMKNLGARLSDAPNDLVRGAMAHKILTLERQCMALWEKRDYFLTNGRHIPEEETKADVVTDTNKLQKRLNNLRCYITKAKNILADNPEDEKALARLNAYSEEKLSLEKRLSHAEIN
jgi:hypothetical protein